MISRNFSSVIAFYTTFSAVLLRFSNRFVAFTKFLFLLIVIFPCLAKKIRKIIFFIYFIAFSDKTGQYQLIFLSFLKFHAAQNEFDISRDAVCPGDRFKVWYVPVSSLFPEIFKFSMGYFDDYAKSSIWRTTQKLRLLSTEQR